MLEILEILKYILPSAVVFATSYYLLKLFIDSKANEKMLEIRQTRQQYSMPLRLQAFERIALFLERINPDNLVMRMIQPTWSAQQLQMELINIVRSEYEHNLSQQVYMSDEAWEQVRNAKEEMIKVVNLSASRLNDNASAADLSRMILETVNQYPKFVTVAALEYVKKELRQLY